VPSRACCGGDKATPPAAAAESVAPFMPPGLFACPRRSSAEAKLAQCCSLPTSPYVCRCVQTLLKRLKAGCTTAHSHTQRRTILYGPVRTATFPLVVKNLRLVDLGNTKTRVNEDRTRHARTHESAKALVRDLITRLPLPAVGGARVTHTVGSRSPRRRRGIMEGGRCAHAARRDVPNPRGHHAPRSYRQEHEASDGRAFGRPASPGGSRALMGRKLRPAAAAAHLSSARLAALAKFIPASWAGGRTDHSWFMDG
jgi:hypothetical protein